MSLLSHRTHAYLCASKGKVVPPATQRTSEVNKKQTIYILGNRTTILIAAGTKAGEVSLALSRVVEDVFRDDEIQSLHAPTVEGNFPLLLQSGIYHDSIPSKLCDMNTPWETKGFLFQGRASSFQGRTSSQGWSGF